MLDGIEADRLISDPPYDFDASGGGAFRAMRQSMNRVHELGLDQGFDVSVLPLQRVQAAVIFCHTDQLVGLLPALDAEFDRYALCYWRKTNPLPLAKNHYRPDTEFYVHAWRSGASPEGTLRDKVRSWDGPVGKSEFEHPTVKPLALMQKIVLNAGGEVLLDPYMGTGTTGLAALAQGKRFVGVERDPRWFDVACRRVEACVRQGELFGPNASAARKVGADG